MTWSEIKRAVESAGIDDGDEILAIECEVRDGDGELHASSQGQFVKLSEGFSETARRGASGCAC